MMMTMKKARMNDGSVETEHMLRDHTMMNDGDDDDNAYDDVDEE